MEFDEMKLRKQVVVEWFRSPANKLQHKTAFVSKGKVLALLKYTFYPLFILDNGMNLISKSLTVLTPA